MTFYSTVLSSSFILTNNHVGSFRHYVYTLCVYMCKVCFIPFMHLFLLFAIIIPLDFQEWRNWLWFLILISWFNFLGKTEILEHLLHPINRLNTLHNDHQSCSDTIQVAPAPPVRALSWFKGKLLVPPVAAITAHLTAKVGWLCARDTWTERDALKTGCDKQGHLFLFSEELLGSLRDV